MGPGTLPLSAPDEELDVTLRHHARTMSAWVDLARGASLTRAELLAAWMEREAAWAEGWFAPALRVLAERGATEAARTAARARVLSGPLVDALCCLDVADDGSWLKDASATASAARARIELMIWEGGARALPVRDFAPWLWRCGHAILDPRGSLRRRAVAARAFEIAADGPFPEPGTDAHAPAIGALLDLARHPEAIVWIHAARALGRLSAHVPAAEQVLQAWIRSEAKRERRRAITALACAPLGVRAGAVAAETVAKLVHGQDLRRLAAAIGPSLPYLVPARTGLWERLASRFSSAPAAPETARGLVRGLLPLWRRGDGVDPLLVEARRWALRAQPSSADDARVWHVVRRETDALDGLDPSADDPELMLDRVAAEAIRLGAAGVAARARAVVELLPGALEAALRSLDIAEDPVDRGAALAALDSCARAATLGTWELVLAAAMTGGEAIVDLRDRARRVREAAAREASARLPGSEGDPATARVAIRVLAHTIDAAERPRGALPSEGGEAAAWVASTLRRAEWLEKPDRSLERPLADLMWRFVDVARSRWDGTAQPSLTYARFATWWVVARPAGGTLLSRLAASEALARDALAPHLRAAFAELRRSLDPDREGAIAGDWSGPVADILASLGAGDTWLALGLSRLASSLRTLSGNARLETAPAIEQALLDLAPACALLAAAVADPAFAVALANAAAPAPSGLGGRTRPLGRRPDDTARLWSVGLGERLGPMVDRAIRVALGTLPVEKRETALVGPYRLEELLGEGAMGEVWAVTDQRNGRRLVLKRPRIAISDPQERAQLAAVLRAEAEATRGIYGPCLAMFVDSGVGPDGSPFLVMDYLVGTDLKSYGAARRVTLEELQPLVRDVCIGLRALHGSRRVHCDLKPGNVFLRLDLPLDARFEARLHRDARRTRVFGATLIDFGLARTFAALTGPEAELFRGTFGYCSPEQTHPRRPLGPASDVYGLAATVFAALTGQPGFFADAATVEERFRAHRSWEPLAEKGLGRVLGARVHRLLRDATALRPDDRIDLDTFDRRFAAL